MQQITALNIEWGSVSLDKQAAAYSQRGWLGYRTVVEHTAVNRFSARTVAVREVTALEHEPRDDPVESRACLRRRPDNKDTSAYKAVNHKDTLHAKHYITRTICIQSTT